MAEKIAAGPDMENERGNLLASTGELRLTAEATAEIVQTKATCPFIGTAVATGALPVRNTFFANKPGTAVIDGAPTISVSDLAAIFVDKQFPDGWRSWKKSRIDWIKNTTALVVGAGAEYLRLRRERP